MLPHRLSVTRRASTGASQRPGVSDQAWPAHVSSQYSTSVASVSRRMPTTVRAASTTRIPARRSHWTVTARWSNRAGNPGPR
ncbi:hypothetical protein ACFFX0_17310 [Citricoccus parietis]|uniref:Uncharacterized protein n=1 Tax=Citricoccus parietis TaxID=592307 RepID=A0ABV5G1Q0_9MICC